MSTNRSPSSEAYAPAPEFRFPVTATQSRCWFLDQVQPGNPALNVAVRWELRGNIRDESIESAFSRIIERHEILRTRLVDTDGVPTQEVMSSADFKLSVVDIRTTPPDAHAARVEAIAERTAVEPFELSRSPLIRATLVRLGQERAILLIVAHQSVFDGFSIKVLGHEFGVIADAIETGTPPDLPELQLQYGDYALWQAEYLASEAVEQDAAYWKEQLGGAAYFEVTPDFPRPAIRSTDGGTVYADLPPAFGARIETEAKRHNLSGFAYGVAVLSAAFHRFTGADEVMFGTQIAGRNEIELEALIGVFINNMVLRLPTAPETRFADQLETAKRVVQDALMHQNMPFNKLVEVLKPKRDPTRNPIISINFNLQRSTFMQNQRYKTFELISRPSHAPGTIYDLNILLIGRPDAWRLTLEYSTDLFREDTARRFLDLLIASFEFAFDRPDAALSELPVHVPHRRKPDDLIATTPAHSHPPLREEPAMPGTPPVDTGAISSKIRPFPEPAHAQDMITRQPTDTPLNETALRLAAIWSKVLDIPPESCDGDFFELGGHSLLVIRMLARVKAELGAKLGLGIFLAEPTLRASAERLDETMDARRTGKAESSPENESTWELIQLRDTRHDGPIVLTINHPILYYMLADSFAGTAAVANLRIPDRDSIEAQGRMSFDDIAAEAVSTVLSHYPNEQFILLGLCVNGRVALKLAQHLEAEGISVPSVVMIDTWAPGIAQSQTRMAAFLHKWTMRRRRWSHYFGQRMSGQIGWVELLRKNSFANRLLQKMRLVSARPEDEDLIGEVTDHLVRVSRYHDFAPYAGEVLLFRTDASIAKASDIIFGWEDKLREDTPVYTLKGWHEDALLHSGIGKVGKIVEKRIRAFDEAGHRWPDAKAGPPARHRG